MKWQQNKKFRYWPLAMSIGYLLVIPLANWLQVLGAADWESHLRMLILFLLAFCSFGGVFLHFVPVPMALCFLTALHVTYWWWFRLAQVPISQLTRFQVQSLSVKAVLTASLSMLTLMALLRMDG